MKVRILARAYQDLIVGHRFYESQAEGLGDYFRESVLADIDALELTAGIHPITFGRFYRKIANRFPFAIYYRIADETVVVRAVLDTRGYPKTCLL